MNNIYNAFHPKQSTMSTIMKFTILIDNSEPSIGLVARPVILCKRVSRLDLYELLKRDWCWHWLVTNNDELQLTANHDQKIINYGNGNALC